VPEARKSFLLVPAGGRGEGTGHLSRCLALVRSIRGECTVHTGYLDTAARKLLNARTSGPSRGSVVQFREKIRASDRWDIVVVDKRASSAEELRELSRHGAIVCLDEGGEGRDLASYLIDSLPRLPGGHPPNIASLGFLGLARGGKRKHIWPPAKVLVSFGGEDSAHASEAFLSAVIQGRLLPADTLTVIEGPLFGPRRWPQGVKVHRGVTGLSKRLTGYDLVITHFGMTALESLALGVPVALLNPGRHHAALGSLLGIPGIGIGAPEVKAITALLSEGSRALEAVKMFGKRLEGKPRETLAVHLSRMGGSSGAGCPACGSDGNRVIARFPLRTYRRCASCMIVYLESFARQSVRYEGDYFGEEYRRQYGKTYLQDFGAIKESGKARIAVLRRLMRGRGGAVVDVGCAFGPFLDAVRDAGLSAFGIDISRDAVRYVKNTLGIPAIRAEFENITRGVLPPGSIRAVTFWYVIEHFKDLHACLKKAASLLEPGGVLAFSTPNLMGASGRKNRLEFLKNSPRDHFTILSPRGLSRMLARYGFRLAVVRVTGHHPERFPSFLGRAAGRPGLARRALEAVSRAFRLGDTFEAYATKENR
jgi:2-polyprenyl-3-methyl-5-hydroxy-6-metoxy-1,4-benzoquinol methylase